MSSNNGIVKLNVGGKLFVTLKSTLAFDKDSYLWRLIQDNRLELVKDENGILFIDRDPTYFHIILNFLRTGKVVTDKDSSIMSQIMEEAVFYNIQGLVQILRNEEYKIVKINVGGTLFETTRETLAKAGPSSILWKMVIKKDVLKKVGGVFFFDREPKYFGGILNFLRNGKTFAIDHMVSTSGMWLEAKFFNIVPIMEILKSNEYHPLSGGAYLRKRFYVEDTPGSKYIKAITLGPLNPDPLAKISFKYK